MKSARTGSEALFGVFDWLASSPTPASATEIPAGKLTLRWTGQRGTRWANRKFKPARVGDTFGIWRVIELLPRDHTANERVRVACLEGHERDCYVFNLRKPPQRCPVCPRPRTTPQR